MGDGVQCPREIAASPVVLPSAPEVHQVESGAMGKAAVLERYIAFGAEAPNHANDRMSATGIALAALRSALYKSAKGQKDLPWRLRIRRNTGNSACRPNKPGTKEVPKMIQPIMKDPIFLAQKSAPATEQDLQAARDLLDTLTAHRDGCVGMAANMIGVSKRIIAFDNEGKYMVMFNPEIVRCAEPYEAEEGCLSLPGTRKARRYRSIKVKYQNEQFQTRLKTFTGWTAQIIQHEIDHCSGVLI